MLAPESVGDSKFGALLKVNAPVAELIVNRPASAPPEIEKVFAKAWLVACSVDHVAEPGDYLEFRAGPYSVLVVRGDGALLTPPLSRGAVAGVAREIVLERGSVALPPDSLVVHCAASGLSYPPMVPIWGEDAIRLQTSRAGFPCFNAALVGYVEATRDDDRERNRLCPPNLYPDTMDTWAHMQVLGAQASRAFGAESDIADWANACALNPARVERSRRDDPAVVAATARVADVAEAGLAGLAKLADRTG